MSNSPRAELDAPLPILAPTPRYFDSKLGVWVLSRYSDVLAAFLEPRLWPVGTRGQDQSAGRDETGKLSSRVEFQRVFSASRLAEWQSQVEDITVATLDELPAEGSIDLLREFAEPVCMAAAMQIMSVDPDDRQQVSALGAQVFRSAGLPYGSPLRSQGEAASLKLNGIFQKSPIPGDKQTFIGISQTLPRLMVNGWAALLQHPSELTRLRAEPQLMPRAVEELMRYAPTIHIISRRAMSDVVLNGLPITHDAQVNLLVASANRDPQQFPDPDRLDVSRTPSSQVALGFGRDFCAGAAIVRMVYGVTTAALLKAFREIAPEGPVNWHRRTESCWPNSVCVRYQRNGSN